LSGNVTGDCLRAIKARLPGSSLPDPAQPGFCDRLLSLSCCAAERPRL